MQQLSHKAISRSPALAFLLLLIIFPKIGSAEPILPILEKSLEVVSKNFFGGTATSNAKTSATLSGNVGDLAQGFTGSVTSSANAKATGFLSRSTSHAEAPFEIQIRVNQPNLGRVLVNYSYALASGISYNSAGDAFADSFVTFLNTATGHTVDDDLPLSSFPPPSECRFSLSCSVSLAPGTLSVGFEFFQPNLGDIILLKGEVGAFAAGHSSFFFGRGEAAAEASLNLFIRAELPPPPPQGGNRVPTPTTFVPEPNTLALLGTGILSLVAFGWASSTTRAARCPRRPEK